MPKALVNGKTIHYLRVGQGPDVILIHGLGGNLAIWFLHVVEKLRHDFRLTAYDLRGHGKSDMTPSGYTTADMAEDLKGLIDAIEIDRVHIVGHSFGADVAMHFTILYPERVNKLAVIEPGIAALINLRKNKDWIGWDFWVGKLEEFGIHVPPEKRCDPDYLLRQTIHIPIQHGPAKGRPRKDKRLLDLLDNTSIIQDYEEVAGMTLDKIDNIQTPTLAIYGEASHFMVTFEYLRDHLPNCRTVLLPGGDHYGPLEQPDVHVDQLKEFLCRTGA